MIDFGLAKALQQQTRLTDKTMLTEFGQVVGTIQYMSPEQAELNQLDIDTRTDVYSLGVMLYELLTGSTPIEVETLRKQALLQVLAAIRDEEPPRPSDRLSSATNAAVSGISAQRRIDPTRLKQVLKGELDWIVMKSIEKDRTRRYESANGLAQDLNNYLHCDVVTARPPSVFYRIRKMSMRHRGLVAALAAIVVLMVSGTTGTTWFAFSAQRAKSLAVRQANELLLEKTRFEAESRRATSEANRALRAESDTAAALARAEASLAQSNFLLADSARVSFRSSLAKKMLHEIPRQYRGMEWNLCLRRADGSDVTCYGHTARVFCVRFAPSGKSIASCGQVGEVMLWDAITGKLLKKISTKQKSNLSLSYHPKGNFIVTNSQHSLSLIDVEDGETITVTCPEARCSQFISDGSYVIAGHKDGSVRFYDGGSLKQVREIRAHEQPVEAVCSNMVSKMFATAGADGMVKLWSLKSGELLQTLEGHASIATCIDFHPDGKTLVSGGWDGFVRVWDTETGKLLQSTKAHDDKVFSVAYSPDGTAYTSSGYDGLIRTWDTNGGTLLRTFSGHDTAGHGNGSVYAVCYHPDAHRIASAGLDSTVRIWDVVSGVNDCELRVHSSYVEDAKWSPDGQIVASVGADGLLCVWDSVSGAIRAEHTEDCPIECLSVSPSSKEIAFAARTNVKVYDLQSKTIATIHTGDGIVSRVAYSPDGKWIAIAFGSGELIILDGKSSIIRTRLQAHDCPIYSLAISSDSQYFATGGEDGEIRLWKASDGSLVWHVQANRGWTQCLAFSPDGTKIASGHERNVIEIRNIDDFKLVNILNGHTSRVHSICYAQGGTRIISGGYEGDLKIWDAFNGAELLSLNAHKDWVTSVDYDPIRQRIACSGRTGVVRILDASDKFESIYLQDSHIARTVAFDSSEKIAKLDSAFDSSAPTEYLISSTGLPTSNIALASFGSSSVVIGFSPLEKYFVYPRQSGIFLIDCMFKDHPDVHSYRVWKSSRW